MPGSPRRVLLLHPGALYGGGWANLFRAKPALVSLRSYLEAHGIATEVLDLQVELGNPEPADVPAYLRRGEELIGGRRFELLAVSCWSSLEYLAAVELARRVRAADPSLPIAVGGYHPTAVPQDFLEPGTPFSAVVQGEGEVVLAELARDPSFTGAAAPVVIPGQPLPLDEPAFDLAGYPYTDVRREGIAVYLSRGCPNRCAFCMEGSKGPGWRAYPVEKAVSLVRTLAAFDPLVLRFCDACFACRAPWRRAFFRRLAEERIAVPLWAETRADRLTGEDLDLVSRLDLLLNFGVETMAPTIAEVMRKGVDGRRYVERVARTLEAVNDRSLLAKVYLVFNHPGETALTAAETLDYVRGFVETHDQLSVFFNAQTYAYFPGSDIALRLPSYERAYGTSVAHPHWWGEQGPHHELATRVRATRGYDGGEAAVAEVKALFPRTKAKMPPATLLQLIAHAARLERPTRSARAS